MERCDLQLEPRQLHDLIADPIVSCLVGEAASDGHIFCGVGKTLLDVDVEVLTTPKEPASRAERVHGEVSADVPQPTIHRSWSSKLRPVVPSSYPGLLQDVGGVVVAQDRTERLKAPSEHRRVGGVEPAQALLVTRPEIIEIASRQQRHLLPDLT